MTKTFVIAILICTAAISCKKKDASPASPPVGKGKVELINGDNQTGTPGMALFDTIIIKITPQYPGDEKHYTFGFASTQVSYLTATSSVENGIYYVKGIWTLGGDTSIQRVKFYLYADCATPSFPQPSCTPLDSLTIQATATGPWHQVFSNAGVYGSFYDIHFSDAQHGIVAGENNTGLLVTDNGGATWNFQTAIRNDFYQLAFSGSDTGIGIVTNNYAYFTTDGGRTFSAGAWTPPITGDHSSTDYCMLNRHTIFSVGVQGHIEKSTDGGQNWEQYMGFNFINELFSITNIGSKTLYACGEAGKVIKTTDGGVTWKEQTAQLNNYLTKIYFFNENFGFAGGQYGTLIRTTDGGSNWSVIKTGLHFAVIEIRFFSDNTGYIVTTGGEIAKSSDGGLSWQVIVRDNNGVSMLNKAHIKDATIAFALQNSSIYTYNLK
ncbi:MAG: YCF48-related protein [Ginsengibacter sp.]